MPIDASKAGDLWLRYQYIRDNGHLDYVAKARKCEDFFAGLQWEAADLSLLKQYKRPALTINKIISTIANVLGEQIFNRTQIAFRPAKDGTEELAGTLTKVFMQISDNNQLEWVRSDVFADGIIGSRGFYDVRLGFRDSLAGEIEISQLNPKNVLIDTDADEYDPDKWGDVFITKWMSTDHIAELYNKADAEALKGASESFWPYGFDGIDRDRDRFGTPRAVAYNQSPAMNQNMMRHVRVIERQHRENHRTEHFANVRLGDLRPVPSSWDRERIAAYMAANPDLIVIKKMVPRIRWTVVADKYVLHDDWSPYKHFTVVPFFPFFRRGRTVGLVENLLGPQELLNKVSSQELHVVNTSANSGWKLKTGALKNMNLAELEARGAQTGLVLELDDINSAEKIAPNQVPTGLDRISYKAEEHIKTISGVSDYRTGNAREDVAAKAVKANQAASSANTAKVMDNLLRTDTILARNVLDLVQEFYTEERVFNIVSDRMTNQTEQVTVNQVQEDGSLFNDLTVGEYAVVVTNQPERDTFEDTQFEHALQLRTEAGVQIPDKFLIKSSKLKDKAEIVKGIEQAEQDPMQQQMRELDMRGKTAEVSKIEAEVAEKVANANLKTAEAQAPDNGQAELALSMRKLEMEHELNREKMEQEFALRREQMTADIELARMKAEGELAIKREASEAQMAIAAQAAEKQAELADAQAATQYAQAASTAKTSDAKTAAIKSKQEIGERTAEEAAKAARAQAADPNPNPKAKPKPTPTK